MMLKKYALLASAGLLLLAEGCAKQPTTTDLSQGSTAATAVHHSTARAVYSTFPEGFETGSKSGYADANVTLGTGSWDLNNALIGSTTSDRKTGSASVRIESTGMATMNFDVVNGAYEVDIDHALYGTDPTATWGLWYSTNGGSTWTQTGSNVTTSSTTLSTATFSLNLNGNVRFQVRKLTGTRINIDNFSITDNTTTGGGGTGGGTVGGPATRDDNMGMGNPSGANATTANNYLLSRSQYTLSYNNSKGMANWVSWHLSTAWKGSTPRCNCFTQDAALPSGDFKATTSNYTSTGFDRGHMCPSDDRDGSDTDNAATFLMSNITPQSPVLNEQTWGDLEAYCRTLITQGNELYIIAGGYGQGGTGSNGGTSNTIATGHINVPSHFWKVIVVLPIGTGDASRVTSTTRVIAIDMPNTQTVNTHTWGYYRTTVDAIETSTGYDFLSNVSTTVQASIESTVDNGPTQ